MPMIIYKDTKKETIFEQAFFKTIPDIGDKEP